MYFAIASYCCNCFLLYQLPELDDLRREDGITILWRQYTLDNHVTSDIDPGVIDLIREDLEVIRDAQFTVLLRFMYTSTKVCT